MSNPVPPADPVPDPAPDREIEQTEETTTKTTRTDKPGGAKKENRYRAAQLAFWP